MHEWRGPGRQALKAILTGHARRSHDLPPPQELWQSQLETVVPSREGAPLLILAGKHRGRHAVLLRRNTGAPGVRGPCRLERGGGRSANAGRGRPLRWAWHGAGTMI